MRKQTGITLIALVITIVVLLILAGISLNMVLGDNGILTQASKAKDKTTEAEAIEKVQIEVAGSYGIDGEIDIEQLNKNLKNINGLIYNGSDKIASLPAIVTLNGYNIEIDTNGNVERCNRLLPFEYQQVKYIESTGTQYIDTGVNAETGISCDLKASYINLAGNASILSAFDATNRFYLAHISNPDKLWTLGYGDYYLSDVVPNADTIYEINTNLLQNEQSIFVDGVKIISKNINVNYNLNLNLYLFAMNKEGIVTNYSSARVYKLKLYKNNVLIRDYIPVLDNDGVACMYDKVEGKFYYNKGTGEFIAGT